MNHSLFLRQVAAFHEAFHYKQPEPIAPSFEDAETNTLRPALIKEELLELKLAHDEHKRVDELDALCDAQYVISGAVLAWGLRALWENYQHMVKLAKIHDFDGHIAAMLGLNSQMEIAARLNHGMSAFKMLTLIQERLTQAVWHLGFSECFQEAFTAVHENNLAKLWSATEYQDWNFTAQIGCDMLTFEKSNEGYIARNQLGKIIKPERHTKVELGRFV